MFRGMTAPVLEPVGVARVALQSVNVEAILENLLCEVTVRQVYRNLERINIEAVYTFPLHLSAVLLDMSIKTQTKELKGIVIEKTEAEDKYEDAITEGDTVIMLEQIEPGLYSMNVGNLQPEDEIEISITYAELFRWHDNRLRFFLPTTIAPRYGDPENVDVQPHQTPEYDLTADNPFAITISVFGELADSSFQSPSHRLDVEKQGGRTVISLKKGAALMDRDFVLNIFMETEEKNFALLDRDGDGHIALASFYPKFPDVSVKEPRCITIIVDCSGSMGGDSIAQARKALFEIFELLRPEDTFNVIRFGSSHKKLFPAPVPADVSNLNKAKNLLEILDADMGGTEIGQAVAAALKSGLPQSLAKEVLLITDGEVWDWEKVTTMAAKSGIRFFTVGVGSSVSEAFVQTLADVTGGACELVSPHEDMGEKIVRHFKRIYFPRAGKVKILWPSEPDNIFPAQIGSIYDGDTLHVFGRFKETPKGDVVLTANLEDGKAYTQRLSLRKTACFEKATDRTGTAARVAAGRELRTLNDSEKIAAFAVQYQLMSPHTNYLAIDVKADREKAKDLPALQKTPQMLAAGWGGTGRVRDETIMYSIEEPRFSTRLASAPSEPIVQYSTRSIEEIKQRYLDNFINSLNALHAGLFTPTLTLSSIKDLASHGAPEDIIDKLIEIQESGLDERIIVVVFLYQLSQSKQFNRQMSRALKRTIAKAYKQVHTLQKELIRKIQRIILSMHIA